MFFLQEVIHVTIKPNEETMSQNEVLEIYATRCPCSSLADNVIAIREFWSNVSPDEMHRTMVIVECTIKEADSDRQESEETLMSVDDEDGNFAVILTTAVENWKYIVLSFIFFTLLIVNCYV